MIRFFDTLRVANARIASVTVLPELYELRNFKPAWTKPDTIENLVAAIRSVNRDGLDPNDYHLARIESLREQVRRSRWPEAEVLADLEVVLTDSLIRLGYHFAFGKVDPEELYAHWNLAREIKDRDPVRVIQDAIDSGTPGKRIETLAPQHVIYRRLKSALATYRAIQMAGGWKPVRAGPSLERGMRGERVRALRRRLIATGDLPDEGFDTDLFDDQLEKAVVGFQTRHRLVTDGVVGRKTRQALNVPVEDRIDQIRVNLERTRWVFHELANKDRLVLVNIAGFEVLYLQNGEIVWSSRAQVGRPFRKTPVFKSVIKYMVLNPTWTVPPGVLYKDVLPEIRRDPGYLKRQNFTVIGRKGRIVDESSIDWSRYSADSFPYLLRQEPGPRNALGRIKIIFPNRHLVYLHDTPSKALFERRDRAFSSGCIRVEKPFELAALLLGREKEWRLDNIMKALGPRETRAIFLPESIPVVVFYWTVRVAEDGRVIFEKDIYDRDRSVLEGLARDFKFRRRPILNRRRL